MRVRRGPGLWLFLLLLALAGGWFWASRSGQLDAWQARLFPEAVPRVRLSPGDFPAGVAAPMGDIASVPLRPTLVGFTPRGSSAALLLAAGGASAPDEQPPAASRQGLFRTAYALDATAVIYGREGDLREALAAGAEHGGVDMAVVSVDRLARWAPELRDIKPRAVLLLGRSRGQEALVAVGAEEISQLRGRRIAAYEDSSAWYFALWTLARAGLGPRDVQWVWLRSNLDAGRALREGKADAAVGLYGDVELAARDRGGKVLATTADAPHLVATVLVVRGEFAARYPDAVRRVLRGMLDAAQAVHRDPLPAARLLGEVAPYLGDPREALKSAPPATLRENLAFFGLSGEAPVTYDELFGSAGALFVKTGRIQQQSPADEARDLGALKYVSEARGP
jgi:ABC-type nitrate/sulfonate/bicarbonate transport system substrate-binding protein